MIPVPEIADITYYFLKDFYAWISPFWPWIWLLIGISIFGVIGGGIVSFFYNHLSKKDDDEWEKINEDYYKRYREKYGE